MTITVVGSATAVEATSITLPTHQAGDLIVLTLAHDAASTLTPLAGWCIAGYRGAGGRYVMLAAKTALSSSETSGTWTGNKFIAATVYRHDTDYLMCGTGTASTGSGTTINYTAVSAYTATGGVIRGLVEEFWVILAAVAQSNTLTVETPPSGFTFRSGLAGGSSGEFVTHDTDGYVTSTGAVTTTVASSVVSSSVSVPIFPSGIPKASGGGLSPALINSQALVRGIVL
jgi:hypothetical protein